MKKGKQKHERCCYNCKYRFNGCKETFKVPVCDKFEFSATCKSI